MVKLTSLKLSSKLRKSTNLVPVIRNTTRWSSTYHMIPSYLHFHGILDHRDSDLYQPLLTPDDHDKIVELSAQLADSNSVTLALQKVETDLVDARTYFDALLKRYP